MRKKEGEKMFEGAPANNAKKKRPEKSPSEKRKTIPNTPPVKTNPMKRVSAPNMPTDLNFSLDKTKYEIEAEE